MSKSRERGIQDKRIAVLRQDRVVAAQLDKMVHPTVDPRAVYNTTETSANAFQNIARDTQRSVNDARSAKEQLPDLERIQQILVSSILSPKDMVQVKLDYIIEEARIPTSVLGTFIQSIREHNKTVYKIDALLPVILGDILMNTGSYTAIVIPESTVDFVINGNITVSHESMELVRNYNKTSKYNYILGNGLSYKKDTASQAKRDTVMSQYASLRSSDKETLSEESEKRALKSLSDISLDVFDIKEVSMGVSTNSYSLRSSMEELVTTPDVKLDGYVYNPEVIDDAFKLTVFDSPEILKSHLIENSFREQRIANALQKARMRNTASMESLIASLEASEEQVVMPDRLKFKSKEDIREFEKALYRPRSYQTSHVYTLAPPAQLGGSNRSAPITMNPPAISVIPIHNTSNPGDPIGAFILTDISGHPINPTTNSDYYGIRSGNYMNENLVSQLSLAGSNRYQMANNPDIDTLQNVYTEMVERDLITRAKRGVLGDSVTLARSEEVMRVMFHRALAGMQTQLVFIPGELMTYFAFDYNEYGIGRSLLDKSMTLAAVRSNLMYANVMAGINNAIGRTKLNITLDEKDKNPQMTVEQILHAHISTRQMGNIVRMGLPGDIVDGITQAAIDVVVTGNERYPDTSMQVEDYNSNRRGPETDYEEHLQDRHTLSFGLSPEIVEMSRGPELATSVVQSNLMLSKQVQQWQDLFKPQVADWLRKYLINTPSLLGDLEDIIRNNIDKIDAGFKDDFKVNASRVKKDEDGFDYYAIVVSLLNRMEVSLPSPDTTSLENQLNALNAFISLLDVAIDAIVSDEMIGSSTGAEEELDIVKSAYRAYFIRDYLRKNNILPDLNLLTTLDDDNRPLLDALDKHQEHMKIISKSVNKFLKKLMKDKHRSKAEYEVLQRKLEEEVDTENTLDDTVDEEEQTDDSDMDAGTIPPGEVEDDEDADISVDNDEELDDSSELDLE